MARLVVNPRSPSAWEIQLKPGTNSIGRGASNDYQLTDPSVSSSHCQVVQEDGAVLLKDLGSTNGTFINRAKIIEAPLKNGQTVHLGGVEMTFFSDAAPEIAVSGPRAPSISHPLPAVPAIPPSRSEPSAPVLAAPTRVATPATVAAIAPPGIPGLPVTPRAATLPAAPSLVAAPVAEARSAPAVPPSPPSLPALAARPAVAAAVSTAPRTVASAPTSDVVVSGPHNCKFHPKVAARLLCNTCQEYFCEACVAIRQLEGVRHKFCRHCGAELIQLQVRLQRPVEPGFFARLPGAFLYPLRGAGVLLVIVGIVLVGMMKWGLACVKFGTLRMIMFGIILEIFSGGYLFTYLQAILHSTTAEDKELPDLPGISNFWDDVIVPFCRLFALALLCFSPTMSLAIWYHFDPQTSIAIAALAASAFGALYFPMAFMAVAILDTIVAVNPLLVVPSILKVPVEYLVSMLFIGLVLVVQFGGNFILDLVLPEGVHTKSMGELAAWFGGSIFLSFFILYLLIISVHMLGLIFLSRKSTLGWLQR